jgi:HPt (histidine-containing phosphotransfer) domain-containing protein
MKGPKPIWSDPMTTELPLLDTSRINELAELFGDSEIVLELFDEFLQECPERMAAMRQALANGEPQLMDSAAHAIKGSSANLGACAVQEMARMVEELARNNQLDHADTFVSRLETEIHRLQEHLKAHGLE